MTPESRNWWQRLTGKFRPSRSGNGPHDLPIVGEDGLLIDPAESANEEEQAAAKGASPLSRWSKRDQVLQQLQEGYERVTQVVSDIQKHLATQSSRTERICTALEQLARTMGDVPAISQQQSQTLEAIASQLETTNSRTQQLTNAVSELPRASRAQTETLAGINRQLEVAGEHNLVAAQTMERLGQAIGTLGNTNVAQTEVLRQMSIKAEEQDNRINDLISRQSKRFVMLFVVTLLLAIAAIAAAIVGLRLR